MSLLEPDWVFHSRRWIIKVKTRPMRYILTRKGWQNMYVINDIWFLIFAAWFMIFDIWFKIYDIWYMIYDIWYMIYDIWYMIYDIRYMIYDIWSMILIHDICLKTSWAGLYYPKCIGTKNDPCLRILRSLWSKKYKCHESWTRLILMFGSKYQLDFPVKNIAPQKKGTGANFLE